MNEDELIQRAKDSQGDHLRFGQALYNIVYSEFPEIVSQVQGTELDPFYDDSNIESFLDYLSSHGILTK